MFDFRRVYCKAIDHHGDFDQQQKGPLQGQKSNSPLQWVGSPQAPEVASHVPRMASLFCPGFCSKFLGNVTGKLRTACRTNRDPDWWKIQRWSTMKTSRLDGKVTCSRLWLKSRPKLRFWRLDGKETDFGGNCCQNSSFEDLMARSRPPCFGWKSRLNSRFEDTMARTPAPGIGWICCQTSSFEDSMASSLPPGFGWTWLNKSPKLKLWRLDGKVTRSRLWLKLWSKT